MIQPRLETARSLRRRRRMPRRTRVKLTITGIALVVLLISVGLIEIRTSYFQSIYFSRWASRMTFEVKDGPSGAIIFPETGPHDERLGYIYLPQILERLVGKGFRLASQVRLSAEHLKWARRGVYPLYREKTQAGLVILDGSSQPLFSSNYPQLVYDDFAAIPTVITQTLLFIENRELLDDRFPRRNPVVEWNRLGRAAMDMLISIFVPDHDVPGGSTLATQIEKYRHSPEGRTGGVKHKAIQMLSGTLRSYLDGPDTMAARRRIVTAYINSVPLGAIPGAGEVRGIGHGLMAWHGADFAKSNMLLIDTATDKIKPELLAAKARAYKEVLSLFLAQRRPAFYLQQDREALKSLVEKHLPGLVRGGVLSEEFAAAVAKADLPFRNNAIVFQPERQAFIERKAANAVRVHLLQLFGLDRLYSLDRLDLTVTSTIDYPTQKAVTEILQKLRDPAFAVASELNANRMLAQGDPSEVIYSFTLRERVGAASVLRVQADNVDGPFNVNEGGKLELGSTAKMRTLVSYMETIEAIWGDLQHGDDPAALPDDRLTVWTKAYLASSAQDKSLSGTLAAALNRTYSASPAETFFTGSGQHRFSNFAKEDDSRTVTVAESLKKSINLPFVRILRDVVQYHVARIPGSAIMLQKGDEPRRKEYLARFANKEGRLFIGRFYLGYRGKTGPEVLNAMLAKMRPTARRLAAVFSVVKPEGDAAAFAQFVAEKLPGHKNKPDMLGRLLAEVKSDRFTLQDKGYVAGIHPLELWLVSYMYRIPTASYSEVLAASEAERQEAYSWLFNSKHKNRQDSRIRIMLEQEAFVTIHQSWTRLGYPFGSLVPTYATALGSSGDRPTALAELIGIIQADGMRYPNARIDALHFAAGTPYETRLVSEPLTGEQVISREVATSVRAALRQVVDGGTAVRVNGVFVVDGKVLPVGGKTGTGDNRYSVFAPGGRMIESHVKSRTATFVFYIGDRFFGTLTAYVPTANAGTFNFTSALPVQILKVLAPKLLPLVGRQAVAPPAAPTEKG